MTCKTDNFKFDPDKTALENLFALVYRTNRVKLNPKFVDVGTPRSLEDGEDDEEGGRSHTVGESHGIWWDELAIKEGV